MYLAIFETELKLAFFLKIFALYKQKVGQFKEWKALITRETFKCSGDQRTFFS